ncbi:universal stress protein [Chloroflexota bacterium]
MYERIVVPLDTSNLAEIPLPYIEEITTKFGSEIILITVSESNANDIVHRHRAYLERMVKKIQNHLKDYGMKDEVNISTKTLVGEPASQILHFTEENDVSLIAMSNRGSSGDGPWFLGNIANKVLRATSKPLLLIRAPADIEAIKQQRLVKQILVPLDGSREGEKAVPYVEELAKSLDTKVTFFQVLELPINVSGEFIDGALQVAQKEIQKGKVSGITYLNNLEKRFNEKGIATASLVTSGSPADQIMHFAENRDFDLVAISTHGRSGIGRWVFGSVTNKVLHTGDVPILVVRIDGT